MLFDKGLEASPVLGTAGIDMVGMICLMEGFMFMNRERETAQKLQEWPRRDKGG